MPDDLRTIQRRRPRAAAFVAGALALGTALTAGCRSRPAGEGPYADKVATYVPRIESSVGVKFRRPPRIEVHTRDQVRQFLLKEFDRSESAQDLAGEEATYKVLGLIPDTMDLRKFLVSVLTEQVIGYYDPATKVLYVIQGAPDDVVGVTVAHELVHALQDQYVNLDSIQHVRGDDDRVAAAQAVIEGQATFEGLSAVVGGSGNVAARLPGGWDRMRDMIRENQSSQPIFSAAPMVIQETMLFPYINGADFVRRYKDKHPGHEPWERLPVSTEQVMHEDAYEKPDAPTQVSLPAVPGAIYTNDMGEFGTRLVIFQHLADANASIRASNGWDGDRFTVAKAAGGNAIVWATVWDTPVDAAEFVTSLTDAMSKRYRTPASTSGTVKSIAAPSRTVRIEQREIGGRNVVLFTDVPKGVSPTLVDIGNVKLSQ